MESSAHDDRDIAGTDGVLISTDLNSVVIFCGSDYFSCGMPMKRVILRYVVVVESYSLDLGVFNCLSAMFKYGKHIISS